MRTFAKNAARPWGFTLVELLTVIAIIGVLATLLSASLANAQKKARQAASTSNLRQIVLAFNLYLDDHQKRPENFRALTQNNYLTERVLLCPEDRYFKNWAGLLEQSDSLRKAHASRELSGEPVRGEPEAAVMDVPHSYFQSFDYFDEVWERIEKNAMGGVAACQLHGIGRQRPGELPAIDTYQGLVLRALKDGTVVRRQVYWAGLAIGGASSGEETDLPALIAPGAGSSQLPLFIDPAE